VKRIPATSNFVYEFNPFTNLEQSNPSQIRLRTTNNYDQKLPCAATGAWINVQMSLHVVYFSIRMRVLTFINVHADTVPLARARTADSTLRRSSIVLPELNLRAGFIMDDPISSIAIPQDTCLPILNNENPLSKQFDDESKSPSKYLMSHRATLFIPKKKKTHAGFFHPSMILKMKLYRVLYPLFMFYRRA